jgi:glycosyltransferase A (GT-A) superfamily protein (DUF2064 family)
MKKNALILFTASPSADAFRKGKNDAERRKFKKNISSAVRDFTDCYSKGNYDFLIFTDSPDEINELVNEKVPVFRQEGDSFGEKLCGAFGSAFLAGYDNVIIIGNDTYGLTVNYFERRFDQLAEAESLIGPACDGGMYLVGFTRETFATLNIEKMEKVKFFVGRDFQSVQAILKESGIDILVLKKKRDVDNFNELVKMVNTRIFALHQYSSALANREAEMLKKFVIILFIAAQQRTYLARLLKAPPQK